MKSTVSPPTISFVYSAPSLPYDTPEPTSRSRASELKIEEIGPAYQEENVNQETSRSAILDPLPRAPPLYPERGKAVSEKREIPQLYPFPPGGSFGEITGLARAYDVTRLASPTGSVAGSESGEEDEARWQRSASLESNAVEHMDDSPPAFLIQHVKWKMKKSKDKIKECSKLFLSLQSQTVLWKLLENLLLKLSPDLAESHRQQIKLREQYASGRKPSTDAERRASKLLQFLEKRKRESEEFFFTASPAGEIPLHLFYLLGLHILCQDVIRDVYVHRVTTDSQGRGMRCVDIPIKSHLRWLDKPATTEDGISSGISGGGGSTPRDRRLTEFVGLPAKLKEWTRKGWIPSEKEWELMGLYSGQTALHIAILNRRKMAVRQLLDHAKAGLSTRANGAFFQPAVLLPFRNGERTRFSDMRSQNLLLWMMGGQSMLKNKKSVYYGGEFPLSFAASTGDIEVMKLLVACAEMRGGGAERKRIIEQQDSFGNTALHMAVYHNRKEALDWLMQHGARRCMVVLNSMGCTPFTASAYTGNAPMFMHILRAHMSRPLWQYGDMQCVEIEMGQLDSYRLQKEERQTTESPGEAPAFSENLDKMFRKWSMRPRRPKGAMMSRASSGLRFESMGGRVVSGLDSISLVESITQGPSDGSFGRAASVEEIEKEDEETKDAVAALHRHPDWRSALEIIITHHVEAMTDPENREVAELMKALVHEKWKRFASKVHWKHRCIPYLCFVLLFSFMFVWHCKALRAESREDLAQSDWLKQTRREVWGMEGAVILCGVPWLLYSAYQGIKMQLVHLDVNMDGNLGGEEIIIFMYKNMQSVGDLLTSCCVLLVALARLAGNDQVEIAFYVVTVVVIWANCLSLMLPNSFLGSLTFMIYRMLVGDVFKFLVIYILLVLGFGLALFGLLQQGSYPWDRGEQENLGCIDCNVYFGNVVQKLVYVSMGEVDQTELLARMQLPFLATGLFIIYAVLSLLLLLNLIIAMMGDTYHRAAQDLERDWFWPYATLVLQYEAQTTNSQKRKYRLGHSSESHSEEGDEAYSPMHYYNEIRTESGQSVLSI